MNFKPEAHRILVVDDDPGMRLAMVETLKRKKYQVDQAESGEAGLALASKHVYQALITDLRMPGLTGIELLAAVKEQCPATEVILVTAYGAVSTAVEAMKAGAYDFLQKPFSTSDLEQIVYNALVKNVPDKVLKPTSGKDHKIVTRSEKLLKLLEMAKRTAKSNATVLIQAESGTGKELLARYICSHSSRADKPVVAINCAALPDNLLESELFGYEKGSFTGALASKAGKFEMANGGTILLDEIGEMPMGLQSKLLRVLQEQEVDRIGGKSPIKIDVRVIAMTNCDLKKCIADGTFREDLYYRINVIEVIMPALRERQGDIPLLVDHFIKKFEKANGKTVEKMDPEFMAAVEQYPWPGNVRELENTMERAVVLSRDGTVSKNLLPASILKKRSMMADLVPDLGKGINFADQIQMYEKTLILKAYGRDGGLIGARALRLDGNQKYAATSVAILEGMRTPEKVDWLSVEAPETIIGFELFGTNSGSSLAGLEAMADLKTELAFPYYDASGRSFHGITVINPHDYSTEIVFTLYDNAGGVLAVSPPQTLAPFMKLATLIADIFPNLPADARPGWMACRADAAITGFQLLISRDGRRMSAAAAH